MKIVVATGGTGGHVHPAIQVAEELRRQGHSVVFAGSLGASLEKIRRRNFDVENFSLFGLSKKNPIVLSTFIWTMNLAFWKARKFLKKYQAQAVIGFGGYGAFPVVLAGAWSGIPTIIHEQNVVPGRANRVLSRFVRKIAVSFEETKKYFPTKKAVFTGCPTHLVPKELSREFLLRKFDLRENTFTLLVMGGSQGSHAINQIFLETILVVKEKINFQIIHLTGVKDYLELKEKYLSLGLRCAVFSYMEAMEEVYTLADLVVSRAGALALIEIGLFGLPSVLIPYPHAQGHQKENALVFVRCGVAKMIEEKELNKAVFMDAIFEFQRLNLSRNEIQQKVKDCVVPDAASRIVKEVISLK